MEAGNAHELWESLFVFSVLSCRFCRVQTVANGGKNKRIVMEGAGFEVAPTGEDWHLAKFRNHGATVIGNI